MAKRPGYIYVMRLHQSRNVYECPCKIGQSVNPTARRRQLGIVMPYKLSILLSFPTDDMDEAERTLHATPVHFRLDGEWFMLDSFALSILVNLVHFADGTFRINRVRVELPEDFWDGTSPFEIGYPF